MQWNDLVSLHDQAVSNFATAAETVQDWMQSPAPGKWSAAEITTHLILAFEAVLSETAGGPSMQLRTTRFQRFVLKWTIVRRIMKGGAFPNGARAPRETRPRDVEQDAAAALARFRRLGAQLSADLTAARASNPGLRLLHPYFGAMLPADALYVSARHIDHHRSQLRMGGSQPTTWSV